MQYEQQCSGMRRRTFLRGASAAAAYSSLASLSGASRANGQHTRPGRRRRGRNLRGDRFGRMFPHLPPFGEPTPALKDALLEMGKPGGLMDAQDALERGPIDLIVDLTLSKDNPNNPRHTAGATFMGQFMDHDMTFDLESRLGEATPPGRSPNERSPSLDLDSVYGSGPLVDKALYKGGRSAAKFRVESGGLFEDLPRKRNGAAIIADDRNDENLIIAGLQLACMLFHNQVVDALADDNRRRRSRDLFQQAQELTRWHYQWLVLHEFLPLFIGRKLVNNILRRGRRFFRPRIAQIPVEFQGAAYRFGHSMVRPSYRANLAGDNGQAFFGMIFDPSQNGAADPSDLRGGARAPRRFIGWQTFFDFGDGEVRPNKLIDTRLSTPLFNLPRITVPGVGGPTSLPQRNLLRHFTWQLPSGQHIAQEINAPALSRKDLDELQPYGQELDSSTPLWYYVLKEAEVMEGGRRLGPVGGRIVGEVIIGLLQLSRRSFLTSAPRWRPTLPTRNGRVTGDFRMVDFLTFAGVDPASRGQ